MSVEQFIQGIIGGLAIGCIYSLIALGITMIIRAADILHFAQGEIVMIGAMTGLSAVWMVGLPFVVVLVIGMIGRRRHGHRAVGLPDAALVAGAAD